MKNLPTRKELQKALCEKSLLEYVCWRFEKRTKKKFIINEHHIALCNVFEDVFYGREKDVVINLPPRYSKTEICVKAFVEWSMIKTYGIAKFIHLSYSDSLALDNSSEIRESIKAEWFREFWKFETKIDKDSKSKWETEQGGGMLATGTMGSVTGYGAGAMDDEGVETFAGAIIIDDPHKPEEASSDLIRNKANERLGNTILSRRNSRKTPVIIIMQRLHEDDMSGYVLRGATELNPKHIVFPAIIDEGEETERALWPAKHTLEELKKMKVSAPRVFAGQYGQAPAPADGNILKRGHFKTYGELPARIEKWLISVDCAFKDKKESDYVVFQAWAKKGAEYFCTDQVRGKMSFTETKTALVAFCRKHPHIIRKVIEDKANGTAIIDSLRKEVSGIIPINPKESKTARVEAISDLLEAGNVYFPENAPWLSDLIEEAVIFPNGKNDDQVDTMSQALSDLFSNAVGNFTEAMLSPTINNTIKTVNRGQW